MPRFALIQTPNKPAVTPPTPKTSKVTTGGRKPLLAVNKPTENKDTPRFIQRGDFTDVEYPIAAHIQHRRLQMLVHSRIYYRLGTSVIDDYTWSMWAKDLQDFQTKYPEIAKRVCFYDAFKEWDASTGAFLPLDDPWVVKKSNEIYKLGK